MLRSSKKFFSNLRIGDVHLNNLIRLKKIWWKFMGLNMLNEYEKFTWKRRNEAKRICAISFFAGMRAIRRSKSMHAFFKVLLKFKQRIHELLMAYDLVARKLGEKNNKACNESYNKFLQLTSLRSLESHVSEVYTKTIFLSICRWA